MEHNREKELLTRITAGDHLAFTELFDLYHHHLGSFIYNITKSRELAEEISLDVFLKIWISREALSEVKNFKAYLFTVSRNAAISSLRKIITERTKHIEWTKAPMVEEDLTEKETYLSLIDEAINALSPQRKKIYLLSREQGLKYEEIATLLGLSRFTVRAHIQQAVTSIVSYVKERVDVPVLLVLVFFYYFR